MIRKIFLARAIAILLLCGCEKNIFINEIETPKTIGFVMEEIEVENNNPEYYSKIAILNNFIYPTMLDYKEEWEQFGYVGNSLSWKLERNETNTDEKFHVVLQYLGDGVNSEQPKMFVDKAIEEINNKNDLYIDVNEWSYIGHDYYCILSREEIIALGNSGCFLLWYVGSGEGEYGNIDTSTIEGVDMFVELYGDHYVRCIEGKQIKGY